MYPNLFKQSNLPKLYNDVSKISDITLQIESMCIYIFIRLFLFVLVSINSLLILHNV